MLNFEECREWPEHTKLPMGWKRELMVIAMDAKPPKHFQEQLGMVQL
jgi:hypothetical protein